jgi:transposase
VAGRRRIWTLEQKLAMYAQMGRCGNVAAFAREYDILSSLFEPKLPNSGPLTAPFPTSHAETG